MIPKGKALSVDLLVQAAAGSPVDLDPQSLEAKTKAAMAKLSASAQAEVEMKVASIFRKYGERLSDEQKADIRRIMAESQEGLEKMRAFKLENNDQPADAFRAYRSEANPGAGHENGTTRAAQSKPRKEKK
jgi:hypothetical protein